MNTPPTHVVVLNGDWKEKMEFGSVVEAMAFAREIVNFGNEARVYKVVEHAYFAPKKFPKKKTKTPNIGNAVKSAIKGQKKNA